MTNWWQHEPKEAYNSRQAQLWGTQARQAAMQHLAGQTTELWGDPKETVGTLPSMLDPHYFKPGEIDGMLPNPNKGKSLLSRAIGAVDSASATALGGKVRQPWDLLRPVQRLFEAENKYVARPLARDVVGAFGGNYDDQPSWLKFGLESLLSPSTYIGPGVLGEVARIAPRLAMGLPAAEGALRGSGSLRAAYEIFGPAIKAAQIPQALAFTAAGTAGGVIAEEVGLPSQLGQFVAGGIASHKVGKLIDKPEMVVHVINPEDMGVYHGTTAEFDGLPDPAKAGPRFASSIENGIYASTDPEHASRYARDRAGTTEGGISHEGGRVVPMVVKKGTKIWNPTHDPFPQVRVETPAPSYGGMLDDIPGGKTPLVRDTATLKAAWMEHTLHNPGAYFLDSLHHADPELQNALVDSLKQKGYQAIQTGEEVIVLDHSALAPMYAPRGPVASIIKPEGEPLYHGTNAEYQGLPRTTGAGAFFHTSPYSAENYGERVIAAYLKPGANVLELGSKTVNRGDPEVEAFIAKLSPDLQDYVNQEGMQAFTDLGSKDELVKVARESGFDAVAFDVSGNGDRELTVFNDKFLSKPPNTPQGPRGAGAAGAMPKSFVDLLDRLNDAGTDSFAAKTLWEVLNFAYQNRSITQKGRQFTAEHMTGAIGTKVKNVLDAAGVRLVDSDVNTYLSEHGRFGIMGQSYGAKTEDLIDHVLSQKQDVLPTRLNGNFGRIVTDPDLIHHAKAIGLVDRGGNLYLHDLVTNLNEFQQRYRGSDGRFIAPKIKPEQVAVLHALAEPMSQHIGVEKVFQVGMDSEATNGLYVALQPLKKTVLTEAGAKVETPIGGVYARQLGPTHTPGISTLMTQAKGVDAGMTFHDFSKAQGIRIQDGYGQMANKWLEAALEDASKTPSQLLPPALIVDLGKTARVRQQSQWLEKELTRASTVNRQGGYVPPRFTPEPELAQLFSEAQQASTSTTMAVRKAGYDDIRKQNTLAYKDVDDHFKALRSERSGHIAAMEKGISPLNAQYPIQHNNRYYSYETGNALMDMSKDHTPRGLDRAMQVINNSIRPVMASLDVSFLGVQGLLAAFNNPDAYYGAAKTIFTKGYGDFAESLAKSGDLDRMIQDGVHWASRNDAAEFLFPHWFNKVPGAKASNTMFTQFGNVIRAQMYKTALKEGMTDGARRQMARTINLVSGYTPSNPSAIEKSMLFAPRYFRSQLGLVADAFSRGDMSRAGAARYVAQFGALGVLTTLGGRELLTQAGVDQPPLSQFMDHNSPNFMRVRSGGQDYSVFGTWDTLFKAVNKTLFDSPEAGAQYLLRSKASPAMSKLYDVITGETMGMGTLDWSSPGSILESLGKEAAGSTPIALQNVVQGGLPNTPGEAVATATQFLGTKQTPLSNTELMQQKQSKLALEKYGKGWSELEPYQKDQLTKDYDLNLTPTTELAKAFANRKAITERFATKQAELDASLPVGPDWIKAHQDLDRERAGAFEEWAKEHPEAADLSRTTKNPADKVRQDYLAIFATAAKEDWTPDERSQALTDFQANLTAPQKAYLDRNLGLSDTPRVKEYQKAQTTLRPYWGIADTLWDRIKTRLPNSTQAQSLQEYQNQMVQEMQSRGVPDQVITRSIQSNPVFRQMTTALAELRTRYRRVHPDVDKALVTWYGYTKSR